MIRKATLTVLILFFLLGGVFVYADENEEELQLNSQQQQKKDDLEREKRELQEKLEKLADQKDTLSNQIQYMDTQIYLAEIQKEETKEDIEKAKEEVGLLENKIDGLSSSLDNLSVSFMEGTAKEYKNRQNISLLSLLQSDHLGEALNRMKYFDAIQKNNLKALKQVYLTKSNFQEQKSVRQKKMEKLDKLQTVLDEQAAELAQQQDAKRQLLTVTENDEAKYEQRIEEINAQIAAFKNFVQLTGLSTVGADSLGTGDGGWYLSQRDERWAGSYMGASNETVLDVGCFITSIAMVFRSKGVAYTPLNIANNPVYFSGGPDSACFPTSYGTAYACVPSTFNGSWPNGLSYHNISIGEIESYVNSGNPVIAGVNGGSHYVVIKAVVDGDYLINDPLYGPDQYLSQRYSLSGPLGVFE